MADLTSQYPNLQGLFSGPLAGYMGASQFQNAQQNQEINVQSTLDKMFREKQNHPVDLARKGADLASVLAGIPGTIADSSLKQNKAFLDKATLQDQLAHQRSKIATEISDEELKKSDNSIKMLLTHDNPKVREIGNQLFNQISEIKKLRLQKQLERDSAESVANIQGGYHVQTSNIAANAGIERARIAAEARKKQAGSLLEQVKLGKMDPQKALATFNILAEFEQDPVEKKHYQDLAGQMEVIVLKQKQAGAVAVPQVDPQRVPTAPLTTPQPPAATPRGGTSTPTSSLSAEDQQALAWANANPNDPRASKIKAKLGIK